METNWYVVKVLPGKERTLTEQFNKEISLGKIKNINRFITNYLNQFPPPFWRKPYLTNLKRQNKIYPKPC